MSLTPILDQLRVEWAARALASFADKLLQPEPSPQEVLERIQLDQASLEWHDRWRAERAPDPLDGPWSYRPGWGWVQRGR